MLDVNNLTLVLILQLLNHFWTSVVRRTFFKYSNQRQAMFVSSNKMTQLNHLKFYIGDTTQRSHIDAVHAQNPKSDQYTGNIVLGVIKQINASGIIATVSRTEMDINRPKDNQNSEAIDEYRDAIYRILASKSILNKDNRLTKNYLHLAIHGMSDERQSEFEIGSRNGDSCSKEVTEWFMRELSKFSKNAELDNRFSGDQSKAFHRNGDPSSGYSGYGEGFNTIQIEVNRTLRKQRQQDLIELFSNMMINFDRVFNPYTGAKMILPKARPK